MFWRMIWHRLFGGPQFSPFARNVGMVIGDDDCVFGVIRAVSRDTDKIALRAFRTISSIRK